MPYTPAGYDPGTFPSGVVTPPVPSTVAPQYWSPFFHPGFFNPNYWPGVVVAIAAAAMAPGRDWDILVDVHDRLDAITPRIFDVVYLGGEPTDPRERASDGLLAVVTHAGGDENDDAMSGTEADIIRVCRFQVTVANRANSQADRVRSLDLAMNAAMNAINGTSLAGLTFPALTQLKRNRYETPGHPASEHTLDGECSYIIYGYASHNTNEGTVLVE